MNFLAHLHLAEKTPESRLGSLLGDFVRGYPWDHRYPEAIWEGIVEHRHVDSFTDCHPSWQKSRDLLPKEKRRYAGIVIDIFYDFFLHRHWSKFSTDESIADFVRDVHHQLSQVMHFAPDEATEAIGLMMEQRWLLEYATYEGIDLTLRRVSERSGILEPIREMASLLDEHEESLEAHFLEFYPDLVLFVDEIRNRIRLERRYSA